MSLELFNNKMTETANAIRGKLGVNSKMTVNDFPVNVDNIEEAGKVPEIPNENEAYINLRNSEWMPMPTTVGENEIYMLFFIPTGIRSLLSFQVTQTPGTKYTVAIGRMDNGKFVSQESKEVLSGFLYENEFYGPDFSNNPITSNGFRQLMIKVSGDGILNFLPTPHSSKGDENRSGWNIMEIACNVPQCTAFKCGNQALTRALRNLTFFTKYGLSSITDFSYMFSFCSSLKVVRGVIGNSSVLNTSYMYNECSSLVAISNMDTSNVRNCAYMFSGATKLVRIPMMTFPKTSSCQSMFSNCSSLSYMHNLNTVNSTSLQGMFQKCVKLLEVEEVGTEQHSGYISYDSLFSGCTRLVKIGKIIGAPSTLSSTFANCSSLVSIPEINTTSTSVVASLFAGCTSLQEIPYIDTSRCSVTVSMFNGCYQITKVPDLNLNNVTVCNSMFQDCASLETVDNLIFPKADTVASMFANCKSLTSIPNFGRNRVGIATGMYSGCSSLISIENAPFSTTSGDNGYLNMFEKCYSLSRLTFAETTTVPSGSVNLDLTQCSIGYQSMLDLFNSLPSKLAGNQNSWNLKIKGNRGAVNLTAADKAIATNKGWTLDV